MSSKSDDPRDSLPGSPGPDPQQKQGGPPITAGGEVRKDLLRELQGGPQVHIPVYLHTNKDSLFGSKHVFRVRCSERSEHYFVSEVKVGQPIHLTCDMCIEEMKLLIKVQAESLKPPEKPTGD